MVELSEYNIKLKSIPGRENGRADMLSRRPDYDQGEKDNQNVVVLPEEMFIRKGGTISYIPEEPPQQNEGIIKQWARTHDLKKINGEWWKGTRKVITGEGPEKCKIQYLVKWKGYPDLENQWVDWDDLHADEALADFKRKNPNTVSHIKGGTSQEVKSNNFTPMSADGHSSPPLTTISGVDLPPDVTVTTTVRLT